MTKRLIALAALLAAVPSAAALAATLPIGSMALLALGAAGDGGGVGSRSALVEVPDSGGGGSLGSRSADAVDGGRDDGSAQGTAVPDALPRSAPAGDPTQPAAATPRRPTYRWQSLVPGAIK
jgi:hypothetical protein